MNPRGQRYRGANIYFYNLQIFVLNEDVRFHEGLQKLKQGSKKCDNFLLLGWFHFDPFPWKRIIIQALWGPASYTGNVALSRGMSFVWVLWEPTFWNFRGTLPVEQAGCGSWRCFARPIPLMYGATHELMFLPNVKSAGYFKATSVVLRLLFVLVCRRKQSDWEGFKRHAYTMLANIKNIRRQLLIYRYSGSVFTRLRIMLMLFFRVQLL